MPSLPYTSMTCLELSMAMVRRYSNTPYIPRGMSHALYVDIGAFFGDVASTQFPLDRLHLCQLLPFSKSEVLLPSKVGEAGLKMYPHLHKFLWDGSEGEHHLSGPISLSIPLPMLASASLMKVCTRLRED